MEMAVTWWICPDTDLLVLYIHVAPGDNLSAVVLKRLQNVPCVVYEALQHELHVYICMYFISANFCEQHWNNEVGSVNAVHCLITYTMPVLGSFLQAIDLLH